MCLSDIEAILVDARNRLHKRIRIRTGLKSSPTNFFPLMKIKLCKFMESLNNSRSCEFGELCMVIKLIV